jgi:membrane-bound metal-dependent hydrolase YbcI (DUF457 family)
MDFLTHLCLPVTVAYVLRPDLFESPSTFLLAGFGLLPDADKFLGMAGLLHSLVTLVPVLLGLLLVERVVRGETRYAWLAAALALSHLLLDFVDGGPVPLLAPFLWEGIGLEYPVRTLFGGGPLGVLWLEGPLVSLRVVTPEQGFNTYGFINGTGVMSALTFLVVRFGDAIGGPEGRTG